MNTVSFFQESKEQSIIKARIVSKYFWVWANVVKKTAKSHDNKIAYMDLFAGPGRYSDGSKSTPLLILEQAVNDKDMREMLITMFNDADPDFTSSLQEAIKTIPGVDKMRYKPEVNNEVVDEEMVRMFEKVNLIPTFLFIDPWGYKGLSLGLINSVLRNWGCDCVFFFNYNRINMGLSNPMVKEHMDVLFGQKRANGLRIQLMKLPPQEREFAIIEALTKSLMEMGGKFVLPFCFKDESGGRTSHHLIFVTKHFKGYEIMKGIMAKESSSAEQGVPSFEYNAPTKRQPLLFSLSRPDEELEGMLLNDFAGCTLTVKQIYERHSVGKRYILKNYRDALIKLETLEKIITSPEVSKRRPRNGKATMGEKVLVKFPKKSGG